MELRAVVVVPAHDEEEAIGACLQALAEQTLAREAFETFVVLDGGGDATADVIRGQSALTGLRVRTLPGPGLGAGAARRAGMEAAAGRLFSVGQPGGLIACTDADSRPVPDWLERQLAHARLGAEVIAGLVELDPDDRESLPEAVLLRRERDAAARLRRVRRV